ncbi:MAG: chorismate mutase [Rhizobiaceae bacterium]|nr:chorismate mutase [Rhizobiaceae bacterium]
MNEAEMRAVLAGHRASIDNIDAALIHILAERFRCTHAVGKLKAEHHLSATDPDREAAQAERIRKLAAEAGLDPDFAAQFLRFIIDEATRHHRAIAAETAAEGR